MPSRGGGKASISGGRVRGPTFTLVPVVRLTVTEVAKRLARHPELVRRWLREGRLRGEQYGREWLVTEREVERFHRAEPERRKRG